jgi:hypothetical protein
MVNRYLVLLKFLVYLNSHRYLNSKVKKKYLSHGPILQSLQAKAFVTDELLQPCSYLLEVNLSIFLLLQHLTYQLSYSAKKFSVTNGLAYYGNEKSLTWLVPGRLPSGTEIFRGRFR